MNNDNEEKVGLLDRLDRIHPSSQAGYTAFSVSKSNADLVNGYIERQEQHHRKMTFQDEVLTFLKMHETAYDSRYVFG